MNWLPEALMIRDDTGPNLRQSCGHGQKHSRPTRLECFVTLLVSSYSKARFLCHRQRGPLSQLTVTCSEHATDAAVPQIKSARNAKRKCERRNACRVLFGRPQQGSNL